MVIVRVKALFLNSQRQLEADMSEQNNVDEEFSDYVDRANAILDRMKKAIEQGKGIRLSAEEMQLISTLSIGQIILADTPNKH